MRTEVSSEKPWRGAALLALAVSLVVLVGACGGVSSSSGTSSSSGGVTPSKCGLGNGKKASSTPIKLGAIVTKQFGVDFMPIIGMV